MLTLRNQRRVERRFRREFDDQVRLERNGAPPPPEIAARMTKPKVLQPLFQVHVDVRGEAIPLRVGPKIGRQAAEMFLIAVNAQIALGKCPGWGNARIETC